PSYEDSKAVNHGSVYQLAFDDNETELASELETKSSHAHFYFAAGPQAMFAPLLGVPYPYLTARRLKMLADGGVSHLAHLGGSCPPEQVPFNVNHEITRAMQFQRDLDVDRAVQRIAERWAGPHLAEVLIAAWKKTEEAILAFPNVVPLYSGFGFVWYRLWARPLVPNIEAIGREERAYYEDFMCTMPHNPNNVDLSRDVLFRLAGAEQCARDLARMDENLWGPVDEAIRILEAARAEAREALGADNVIEDQFVRLKALRCWFVTQRSVAAWVAGVHGYLQAQDSGERASCRRLLRDMMEEEIDNSRELSRLLDSGTEFMAMTDQGETPLIHGENLRELLVKRIALMRRHMDDEPYIDPDYIERIAGRMLE
ncbi:MAG: hypothetical protein JSV91_03530, partial [Phycisphaerales bacterium]